MDDRITFLRDILHIAIEGGINYWADVKRIDWGWCRITLVDRDEEQEYTVASRAINKAIEKLVKEPNLIRDDLELLIYHADKYNDSCDVDAELADCIIQMACFDDILYS
jgi:hypothetical protein